MKKEQKEVCVFQTRWKKEVLLLVVIIYMLGLGSASFEIENNFSRIDGNYLGGELIRGEVKMSFDWQNNELFSSNFEGGVSLLDLLNNMEYNNSAEKFLCDPVNCERGYEVLEGDDGAERLDMNLKGVYGFRIVGKDVEITHLEFSIESDAGGSCTNQVYADIFVDGVNDIYNTNSGGVCGSVPANYGCFDGNAETQDAVIEVTPNYYCEAVNFTAAPGYELGAIVQGSGNEIEFRLYDINGVHMLKSCEAVPSENVVKCNVDYSSDEKFDGYVCISKKNEGGDYKIKRENKGSVCGGAGRPGVNLNLNNDFQIYGRPLMYDYVGVIEAHTTYNKLNAETLVDKANEYVGNVYAGDCHPECVVPFKILGNPGQSVSVEDIYFGYKDEGVSVMDRKIFRLAESPLKINSSYLVLDVEKMGFKAPEVNGKKIFKMSFDGEEILSKEINVHFGFDFDVNPGFALLGRSVTFNAATSKNVTSSEWDFGDGSSVVYSGDKSAQHTYRNESSYVIKVTLKTANGQNSTKKFVVVSGDAETSANITINDYKKRIENIKKSVGGLAGWVKTIVEEEINLGGIESSLNRIKSEFESSSKNEEYISIINELLDLEVPISIYAGEKGSLPALVGFEEMNVEHIKEISGGSSSDSEEIKNAILWWIEENCDPIVSFDKIVLKNDFGEENLMGVYDIEINKKSDDFGTAYLIINYPVENLKFKSSYEVSSLGGGSAVKINEDVEEVEFAILGEDLNIEKMGIYVSPVLSELGLIGDIGEREKQEFNWTRFAIWMLILLAVVFAVYIFLQSWYKRNYERSLFRNPNDLYNIINFIYNSRRVELKDGEIRKKLSEKKWSGEQITYAFKKIDGKRTGMWEIPLFKFVENRKVKKELEKKNPGMPIDARFIKRSNL
ncbi:MAG: PKD domain-containing protein [archaeon]